MKKICVILIAGLMLSSMHGCMYYYKVHTVKNITPREIKNLDSLFKYLILHQGDSAWHIENMGISNSQVSGILSVLPANHFKFRNTNPEKANRYRYTNKHNETYVLNEAHIYLSNDTLIPVFGTGNKIGFDCSTIKKIEIYYKARGMTTASWVLPVVLPLSFPIILFTILTLSGGPGSFSLSQ